MNRAIHKACVWAGGLMMPLLGGGMILAGLFPPAAPGASAIKVARHYADHEVRIQIGLVVAALGVGLLIPFYAAVAWEVRKMAGGRQALASIIQVMTGTALYVITIIPLMVFMAASFRPERSPEVTQALHDLGWLAFIGPVASGVVQYVFLGIAMLMDSQDTPTFPRWFGYATIFVGTDFLCAGLIVLTENGPFAWDGILAYYVPFITIFIWIVGAIVFLLRSIDREWAANP